MAAPVRFRFAEFVLSPRRRLLLRDGSPVPLIPKYFDLLVLLVSRRADAVPKQVIFSEVWSDVVVSDGALSQAVRTLRRALGDDSRESRFIRTVSRHGYQFVCVDVVEELDDHLPPATSRREATAVATDQAPSGLKAAAAGGETMDVLVDRLCAAAAAGPSGESDARDLAERLHTLGTADVMSRIVARPRHAAAVAVMRDARWNVPGAGRVPLVGDTESVAAVAALIRLRFSSVKREVARRWAGAAWAGAVAGIVAGACGGIALIAAPGSTARPQSILALATIGAAAGTLGAAGIGAGLAAAEALARSRRGIALAICGAASGAVVATGAHLVLHALLDGLVGLPLPADVGAIDGVAIGGAAGAGYALATRQLHGGGLAAPSGWRRVMVVLTVGAFCAAAATTLALMGRPLVGGLVHEIARSSQEGGLVLAPLGSLIGEPGFGPLTRFLLGAFEGGVFGLALAWGLTRRP